MKNQLFDHAIADHKNDLKSINVFWLGFTIYSVFLVCNSSDLLNVQICLALQFLGIIFILVGLVKILCFQITNLYLKLLFIGYFVWLLLIIFRGASNLSNYMAIKNFLFSPGGDGGLLYFVPLMLFLPRTPIFLKKTFDAIILFGICYFLFNVIFLKKLIVSGDDATGQELFELLSVLSIPCGFILCSYTYHSKSRKLFAFGVIFFTFLLAILRARRGLLFFTTSILLSTYLIYFFHSKKKILLLYLAFLFICLASLYANSIYHINQNRLFSYISQRGDQDTRTDVEIYFYNDMKLNDWIIGRGINGNYFCPNIEENQVTNYRNVIETGYLQIILKGGLISLILMLLIFIPACILGIFFSENILTKASGFWILIFILCLYPRDVVKFDFNYILVWMCVGICFSKNIRRMSENNLKDYLLSPKSI